MESPNAIHVLPLAYESFRIHSQRLMAQQFNQMQACGTEQLSQKPVHGMASRAWYTRDRLFSTENLSRWAIYALHHQSEERLGATNIGVVVSRSPMEGRRRHANTD
jgi:hypothetical protein